MAVKITMTDGTVHRTTRHTKDHVEAAWAANVGIPIGGPEESLSWVPSDGLDDVPPEVTLYPAGIASIEEGR